MNPNPVALESLHEMSLACSGPGYDFAAENTALGTFTPPPLNSLAPGAWLADSCIGDGEAAQSARAIRDSYRFGSRDEIRRYPVEGPRNVDGEEVFLTVSAPGPRSLVFTVSKTPVEGGMCLFADSRVGGEDYRSKELRVAPERERSPKKRRDSPSHTPDVPVSDSDVDSVYLKFGMTK